MPDPIIFPANPADNDTFVHPYGWTYQYDAESESWGLVGSRGIEGPPGPQGLSVTRSYRRSRASRRQGSHRK